MASKYDVETKEIDFFLKMTTNILLLFAFVLYVFSILFPQSVPMLTLIFIIVIGWFMLTTNGMIKLWKKKWNR
jgi:uncharacterized membrane protein